jgi:tRNA 2-thiouridine synthesizing protein A
MTSGDLLVIECTDPLTAIDIPNLLNQTGDTLEDTSRADKVITFRIRKRWVVLPSGQAIYSTSC